jgi:hypothetical protein
MTTRQVKFRRCASGKMFRNDVVAYYRGRDYAYRHRNDVRLFRLFAAAGRGGAKQDRKWRKEKGASGAVARMRGR